MDFEKELFSDITKSMVIYCDTGSAIHNATTNSFSYRTKRGNIKAKFISEAIKNDKIVLKCTETNTSNMLANMLTKGVVAIKQTEFLSDLGIK